MNYDKVPCEKCDELCEAHYLLSPKAKGLWVKCKNCGMHARPYEIGYLIKVKPSKPMVKLYGKEKSERIAVKYEKKKGDFTTFKTSGPKKPKKEKKVLLSISNDGRKLFCDAGTKNNGRPNQKCIIVVTNEAGSILAEEWIGNKTNNEGELAAIRRACGFIKKNEKNVVISTDSDLSFKLVNLEWFAKAEHLKSQVYDTIASVKRKNAKLIWEPRDKNKAGHYIENKHGL